MIRFCIYQFCICTFILSTITAALQADHSLYINEQGEHNKTAVIFLQIGAAIKAASTLLAMWAFHLQYSYLVQVGQISERFQLKGKRWVLTFAMFINGLEPLILNLIVGEKLVCKSPFNFENRWKLFETLLTIPQLLLVQWLAIKAYTTEETLMHCCIMHEDHVWPEECEDKKEADGKIKNLVRRASVNYAANKSMLGIQNSDDEDSGSEKNIDNSVATIANQPTFTSPNSLFVPGQRSRGASAASGSNWSTTPTVRNAKDSHVSQELKYIRRLSRCLDLEMQLENFNSNQQNIRNRAATGSENKGFD